MRKRRMIKKKGRIDEEEKVVENMRDKEVNEEGNEGNVRMEEEKRTMGER